MELFSRGKWITAANYRFIPNLYLEFSETFRLGALASSYALYLCARNNYAVYVNDALAGFGQAPYAAGDICYDRIELRRYLKSGENTMRIVVYGAGADFTSMRREPCALLFELFSDKELFCISSKETKVRLCPYYKSGEMPLFSQEKGFSFHYDFTKEESTAPYFDSDLIDLPLPSHRRQTERCTDGGKCRAVILSQGIFKDDNIEKTTPAEKMQTAFLSPRAFWDMTGGHLPPQSVPDQPGFTFDAGHYASGFDGIYILLDCEQIQSGYFSLDLELAESARILVGWGEHLEDLRVRCAVGKCNFAFSLQGNRGANRMLFPFVRLCCRYLALHIYADRCTLRYAGLHRYDYPLSEIPSFSCNDLLHRKIYDTCRKTLTLCLHDGYEYAPYREGGMNIADAAMQMLCGYYVFGEYRQSAAALRQMAHSLSEDDFLSPCPCGRADYFIPADNCRFVIALEQYVRHSGDIALAAELLYEAKRATEAILGRAANKEGLADAFFEKGVFHFYDWQSGLSGAKDTEDSLRGRYDCPLNALLSIALSSLAALYRACGRPQEAEYYLGTKKQLNENIRRTFFDAEKGLYFTFYRSGVCSHMCELTQSLALLAGCAHGEEAQALRHKLTQGMLIPCTLTSAFFKYEALLQQGEAWGTYVFSDIAEKFGNMLFSGATTFYETEDGASAFANAGALCCGSAAYPAYFYMAYLCGIRAEEGEGFCLHEPLPGAVNEPHCRILTPKGELSV